MKKFLTNLAVIPHKKLSKIGRNKAKILQYDKDYLLSPIANIILNSKTLNPHVLKSGQREKYLLLLLSFNVAL